MAQFARGITFLEGSTGHTAAEIHALIDNAHILPGFITDQPQATPVTSDRFGYVQSATNTLKSVTHGNLIASFPKDAAAGIYSLRRLGTAATMAAAGNDSRLRNSVSGFRFGQGAGVDRAVIAGDFKFLNNLGAGTNIDWNLGNVHYATIAVNRTFTMTNGFAGRQITIIVKLNGHTATVNGVADLVTVGSGTNWARYYLTVPVVGTIVGFRVLS